MMGCIVAEVEVGIVTEVEVGTVVEVGTAAVAGIAVVGPGLEEVLGDGHRMPGIHSFQQCM